MSDFETLERTIDAGLAETKTQVDKALKEQARKYDARLHELEQKAARLPGPGAAYLASRNTFGGQVIEHERFGEVKQLANARGKITLEVKNTITSTLGAPIAPPDFQPGITLLPTRRLFLRDLVAPGSTSSNAINYAQQSLRTLNAATVSEGARKAESNLTFELKQAPVATIAHWINASRQIVDDQSQLQSTLDGEMRLGVSLAEEAQMLLGDGVGTNILGIIPQSVNYETGRNVVGDTRFDTLAHGLAQATVALLPSSGIVMNDNDLEALKVVKDSQGRYIGGGPFGPPITSIWGRPTVGTPLMPANKFLCGAFRDGAQVFDRETVNVLISSENEDNFVRNLLTILAESRLAFIVRRPQAFVYGTFP